MKKPSSKIREDIAKLQEQLKQAETREAEQIGRVALKAGLGELEVNEIELLAAFEKLAERFRGGRDHTARKKAAGGTGSSSASVAVGQDTSGTDEA